MRRTEERGSAPIGIYIVTTEWTILVLGLQRAWLLLLVLTVPPGPRCPALLTPNPPQRSLVIKGSVLSSAYGTVWGQRRERQAKEKPVQQVQHVNKARKCDGRSLNARTDATGKWILDFTSWLADLCPDGLILVPCSSLLWFSRNRAQERIGRWEQKELRMWRSGTQMQNWCEDEDRAGQFMY